MTHRPSSVAARFISLTLLLLLALGVAVEGLNVTLYGDSACSSSPDDLILDLLTCSFHSGLYQDLKFDSLMLSSVPNLFFFSNQVCNGGWIGESADFAGKPDVCTELAQPFIVEPNGYRYYILND